MFGRRSSPPTQVSPQTNVPAAAAAPSVPDIPAPPRKASNRPGELDSRLSVGYVPAENLVGRANIVFFSIAGKASPLEIWKWPSLVRLSRMFHFVN